MTKEPTASEAGERTYTCTLCGETRTEAVPATGGGSSGGQSTGGAKTGDLYDPILWGALLGLSGLVLLFLAGKKRRIRG